MLFTKEELLLIADLVDKTPLQGTLHTLPAALSKLAAIRNKLQAMIETADEAVVKPKSIESRTM